MGKAELEMAVQLVDNLKGSFVPTDFTNDYRDQLRAMLEAKLEGKEITIPEAPRERRGDRSHGRPEAERRDVEVRRQGAGGEAEEEGFDAASAPLRASCYADFWSGPEAWSCAAKRLLSIFPW